MDLAEELEKAVGIQPHGDVPATQYLGQGRRARARRRLAAYGAGASVIAVLGVGSLAFGHSPSLTTGTSVDTPSNSASSTPTSDESTGPVVGDVDQQDMARSGQAATYTLDGRLQLATGWHVTQRIESPWRHGSKSGGGPPVDRSVALALAKGSRVQWVLLDWESADTGSSGAIFDNDPGARGFASLEAYVDVEMALHQGRSTDQLVAFGTDGSLEPRNGITIREQSPLHVANGTNAIIARLQMLDNEWWVFATDGPSGASYIPVMYPFEGDENSLQGFGAHVRDLLAQGELG